MVDNEEVGNVNTTGATSTYLVSSDVNPGVHPMWPEVWEAGNAPRLGHSVNLKLYGGGFNANSEFIAWTRAYLDDASIAWQTATYKGRAYGGTIGNTLSRDNMEVIGYGVPVLSITQKAYKS